MNEVLRKEMKAADLPRELAQGFDPGANVVVTVSQVSSEPLAPPRESIEALRKRFGLPPRNPIHSIRALLVGAEPHFSSSDEIVAHVREIRDGPAEGEG